MEGASFDDVFAQISLFLSRDHAQQVEHEEQFFWGCPAAGSSFQTHVIDT